MVLCRIRTSRPRGRDLYPKACNDCHSCLVQIHFDRDSHLRAPVQWYDSSLGVECVDTRWMGICWRGWVIWFYVWELWIWPLIWVYSPLGSRIFPHATAVVYTTILPPGLEHAGYDHPRQPTQHGTALIYGMLWERLHNLSESSQQVTFATI